MTASKLNNVQVFFILLDFFASHSFFTMKEIATATGIPPRTLQRHIQNFREAGFDIKSDSGHGGGYSIASSTKISRKLSNDELLAILFAFQTFDSLYQLPFENINVSQTAKRLLEGAPPNVQDRFQNLKGVIEFSLSHRDLQTPELRKLYEAALKKQTLEINYTSSSGHRTRIITPLGIYMLDGVWYCPAYCHFNEDERLFRADRIEICKLGPVDSLPHHSLSQWRQQYSTSSQMIELSGTITEKGLIRAQALAWMDYAVVENDTFSVKVNPIRLPNVLEDLLSFGPELTLKAPLSVVEQLKSKLVDMLALY